MALHGHTEQTDQLIAVGVGRRGDGGHDGALHGTSRASKIEMEFNSIHGMLFYTPPPWID